MRPGRASRGGSEYAYVRSATPGKSKMSSSAAQTGVHRKIEAFSEENAGFPTIGTHHSRATRPSVYEVCGYEIVPINMEHGVGNWVGAAP